MKKAVKIFLWIAIVLAILEILDSGLALLTIGEQLTPNLIAYEIGYIIGSGITIWFSLSTRNQYKHTKNK